MALAIVSIVAGVFGLLIGSFLNVVIYRVPAGQSIVSPPSQCPHCGHRIRWIDNLPVVSWLVRRGRCRDCGAPIPPRYLVIELATGLAFAAVALGFAPGGLLQTTAGSDGIAQTLVLLAYLWFTAAGIALAAIDVEHFRLPDAIVFPSAIVIALLLSAAAALRGDLFSILTALIAAIAGCFAFFLIILIKPGGLGRGDAKLALVTGLVTGWVGWPAFFVGLLAAFLLGSIVGLAMIALRRGTRASAIPFGPWLLLGAWVGILAGPAIWTWYRGVLGLA